MWPAARASRDGEGFSGEFPRFGTSYHNTPLALDESTGRSSVNVAEYSTIPRPIARSEEDIVDDGVERILRVEFAVEAARQALIARAGKRRWLAILDSHADEATFHRRRCAQQQEQSLHQTPPIQEMESSDRHVPIMVVAARCRHNLSCGFLDSPADQVAAAAHPKHGSGRMRSTTAGHGDGDHRLRVQILSVPPG
jgi:hypothetical protein